MNCIIIDDEPLAIKVIQNHIEQISGLKVLATFEDAMDGFTFMQKQQVDLLFLDIQMPQITGLALLKSLRQRPHVIICTAYREYALEGYELDVVDYLVKPIPFARFLQAISKVYRLQNKNIPILPSPTELVTLNTKPFVYVKAEKCMVRVLLEDILYVESIKNHVRIISKKDNIITLQKISQMEEKLPARHFLRVHRSFIVALNKIEKFSTTNLTIEDTCIPIGRFYKNEVVSRLEENVI